MTKLLQQAIEQLEQLPEDQQNAAAGALIHYLAHMRDLQLTDEQLAEVRRRRAKADRVSVPLAEVRQRLRRFSEWGSSSTRRRSTISSAFISGSRW